MHLYSAGLMLLLWLIILVGVRQTNGERELRILGLQPMTGDAWPGGWPCLVAVEMAVEGINQHPDLLDGYVLKYDYIDHEVRLVHIVVKENQS